MIATIENIRPNMPKMLDFFESPTTDKINPILLVAIAIGSTIARSIGIMDA